MTVRAIRTASKVGIYQFLKEQLSKGFDPEVWCTNDTAPNAEANKRGYRRVETVDANGHKSYSITYEPVGAEKQTKVKLSSVLK